MYINITKNTHPIIIKAYEVCVTPSSKEAKSDTVILPIFPTIESIANILVLL